MLGRILSFIGGLVVGCKYGFVIEFLFWKIYFNLWAIRNDKTKIDNDDDEMKLVMCVRNDLKMGKGKIASQCGHAAIGAYSDCLATECKYLKKWLAQGQRKIVVKINDDKTMSNIYMLSRVNNLNVHIVSDAGRTQVSNGSKTVIAVGPGPSHLIDKITGEFPLL